MTDHGRNVATKEMKRPGNQDLVGLWVNSESYNLGFGALFFGLHVATITSC
jgi:hypothetical protein